MDVYLTQVLTSKQKELKLQVLSFFEPQLKPLPNTFAHFPERSATRRRSFSFSGYRSHALQDLSDHLAECFPRSTQTTLKDRHASDDETTTTDLAFSDQHACDDDHSSSDLGYCDHDEEGIRSRGSSDTAIAWPDTDSEEDSDSQSPYASEQDYLQVRQTICSMLTGHSESPCKKLALADLIGTPSSTCWPQCSKPPSTQAIVTAASNSHLHLAEMATRKDFSQIGSLTVLASQPHTTPALCRLSEAAVREREAYCERQSEMHDDGADLLRKDTQTTTTLMLRNLPRHISQAEFLKELNASGFEGTYDFAYMPQRFDQKENKGYAFINFLSTANASAFLGKWHNHHRFGSKDTINISPAMLQGLQANLQKWVGQRFRRIKNPDLRPFVLDSSPKSSSPQSRTAPFDRFDFMPALKPGLQQPLQ